MLRYSCRIKEWNLVRFLGGDGEDMIADYCAALASLRHRDIPAEHLNSTAIAFYRCIGEAYRRLVWRQKRLTLGSLQGDVAPAQSAGEVGGHRPACRDAEALWSML